MRKYHREGSVLIIKPHRIDYEVDERVSQFCQKALVRGVAEYQTIASKDPMLARNRAIMSFLTEPRFRKKTHIFFIDADTCPVNEFCIERLLGFDKPVIGGVTPMAKIKEEVIHLGWNAIIETKDKKTSIGIDELPVTLFNAVRTGGACLLVRRDVLQKLKPPYQDTIYNPERTKIDCSEDYYFCDKIKEAGFQIWIDPETKCHHYHKFDLLDVFDIWMNTKKER